MVYDYDITFLSDYKTYYSLQSFQVKGYANYTVTFEPGGDDVENMPRNVTSSKQFTDSYTVTTTQPTREGYKFTGWKDEQGNMVGTSAVAKWYEGDGANVNRTLTAQWELDDTETHTATWLNGDGTTLYTTTFTGTVDASEFQGTNPTKATDKDWSYTWNNTWTRTDAANGDVTFTPNFTQTCAHNHSANEDCSDCGHAVGSCGNPLCGVDNSSQTEPTFDKTEEWIRNQIGNGFEQFLDVYCLTQGTGHYFNNGEQKLWTSTVPTAADDWNLRDIGGVEYPIGGPYRVIVSFKLKQSGIDKIITALNAANVTDVDHSYTDWRGGGTFEATFDWNGNDWEYKTPLTTPLFVTCDDQSCDHEHVTWTDNSDGTHDGVCGDCGTIVKDDEKHTYDEDGVCKCGAVKAPTKDQAAAALAGTNFTVDCSKDDNHDTTYNLTANEIDEIGTPTKGADGVWSVEVKVNQNKFIEKVDLATKRVHTRTNGTTTLKLVYDKDAKKWVADAANLKNVVISTACDAATVPTVKPGGGTWTDGNDGHPTGDKVLTPDDNGDYHLPNVGDIIPKDPNDELKGWLDEEGNPYTPGAEVDPDGLPGDKTLVPVFDEKSKVVVFFCAEEGSFADSKKSVMKTFYVGDKITAPEPDPEYAGHSLLGWTDDDGNVVEFNDKLVAVKGQNLIYHAKWQATDADEQKLVYSHFFTDTSEAASLTSETGGIYTATTITNNGKAAQRGVEIAEVLDSHLSLIPSTITVSTTSASGVAGLQRATFYSDSSTLLNDAAYANREAFLISNSDFVLNPGESITILYKARPKTGTTIAAGTQITNSVFFDIGNLRQDGSIKVNDTWTAGNYVTRNDGGKVEVGGARAINLANTTAAAQSVGADGMVTHTAKRFYALGPVFALGGTPGDATVNVPGNGGGNEGGDEGGDNPGGDNPGGENPGNPPYDPGDYYDPTPVNPDEVEIDDEQTPLAGANGLNSTDHMAYIIGYEDDTVRPGNNITRAEVVTIFFRLMTDAYRAANWSTTNDFSDVADGSWYNNAISTCANAGLVNGYGDSSFKPNQSITRAEFATIAARFLDEEITGENAEGFSDIAGHWAETNILRAAEAGWVNGDNGMFRPDDYITRAEAITIVNRMLNRVPGAEHMVPEMKTWTDNPKTAWYYEAIQEATNEHDYEWIDETDEHWTELLTVRDWAALEKEWADEYSAEN